MNNIHMDWACGNEKDQSEGWIMDWVVRLHHKSYELYVNITKNIHYNF